MMNEWQCDVCGYSREGEGPWQECPACGADADDDITARGIEDLEADNSIALYMREIDRIPLLTADDEVSLGKRMERGRKAQTRLQSTETLDEAERARLDAVIADGEAARRKLIAANTRLVVSIAKKYWSSGMPFLDLIQESNLGLMQAIERYDYRRGCKLSTYATRWIQQAVARGLAEQGRIVRLPAHADHKMRRLRRATGRLRQDLGRDPTLEEVAAYTGTEPRHIRWIVETWNHAVSLEEIAAGDDEASS